jgi:hypothetical protein
MQAPLLHEAEWEYVRRLLPSDREQSARQTPAPLRCRNVPDAAALMRMALAYARSDLSLKDVAAWASTLEVWPRSLGQACFTAYERPRPAWSGGWPSV